MNIFFYLVAIVMGLVIFGLPLWNLARLQHRAHALWLITPPVLFLCIAAISGLLEYNEMVQWYKLMNQITFMWAISSLMLFGVSILVMIIHLVCRLSKRLTFWAIIVITSGYFIASVIGGQVIGVKDVYIESDTVNRAYHFVHLSDLHSGSTDKEHAQNVAEVIEELNPEFIVITGDVMDEFYAVTNDIQPLADLSMPVYVITGNHEYYIGPNALDTLIEGTDIQLIDSERIVYEDLNIIGVDELATVDMTLDELEIDQEAFTILLDHQPKTNEVNRAQERGVDLMLSGHTHKGQIWPMHHLIQLQFPYVGGLYTIDDMHLYVNEGTGTLGPKLRLGTVNEITHIHITPSL
jgi:predicted MPP superfamily phosphohydrolase